MQKLTERRKKILNIVIQEYTQTAQPIGSSAIVNKYNLGVSAATVRNDLAALEKEGLLTHPHTSAGRIPTDAGYRYFVHNLLAKNALNNNAELAVTEQRTIRAEFQKVPPEMDQWLRLTTAVLARTSNSAALATAPRAPQSRFKHIELVGIQETKVLLVLVLHGGIVKQRLLDLGALDMGTVPQDRLSLTSNELNDLLEGMTVAEMVTACAGMPAEQTKQSTAKEFTHKIALLVIDIMERIDNRTDGQIYRDGLSNMLEAPEFSEGYNVRNVVKVLEERPFLEEVMQDYHQSQTRETLTHSPIVDKPVYEHVHVMIAGNGRFHELADISLVLGRYGIVGQATGMLGVIGPMRMSYGRTISTVRFVATLMSELVEDIYGV